MNIKILKKRDRVRFDIANRQHLAMARAFFETNTWGADGCPFQEQFPFQSVPDMIKTQIVHKFLKIDQTVDQKTRIL